MKSALIVIVFVPHTYFNAQGLNRSYTKKNEYFVMFCDVDLKKKMFYNTQKQYNLTTRSSSILG